MANKLSSILVRIKNYATATIFRLVITGIVLYTMGIYLLGWMTISTGGLGLFGVQPRGIGATFGLFLTTWVYMFPFVYVLGVMYKYSNAETVTKDKRRKK